MNGNLFIISIYKKIYMHKKKVMYT